MTASQMVKSRWKRTLLTRCMTPLVQPISDVVTLARTPPPSTYTTRRVEEKMNFSVNLFILARVLSKSHEY
ncbi:hypothetical protein DPMN_150721 [Dreissena polymorpha]|uniref:Uncharacterized protein n=1 Tax=Dreissena polymorpha TaxID=45954 RepID=A0A9D4FFV5_DREPO|nr:hypothetical protein DPMN_150721 [Dreissena polymorpha]